MYTHIYIYTVYMYKGCRMRVERESTGGILRYSKGIEGLERGEEETGRAGMRGKVNGRERKIWKWQKRQGTSGMRHED